MSAAFAFEIERIQGDTEPWEWVLMDSRRRKVLDLTDATVKVFVLKLPDSTVLIDGVAATHNNTGGKITFEPTADDVDIPGDYEVQVEITLPTGKIRTYPTDKQGRGRLHIGHKIGGVD